MRLQLKLGLGAQNVAATGKPVNKAWYGLKFRDTFTISGEEYTFNGLEFERTGMAANYDQGLGAIPEELLTVHNKLKRCVVGYDGKFKYYLDGRNSMWKEGSYRPPFAAYSDGKLVGLIDNYGVVTDGLQVGNCIAKIDGALDAKKVGCVMNIFDGVAASWYAVIVDIDYTENGYVLSHPHIDGFGSVGDGLNRMYMIGDAKLGGQDGNVMVEIPSFWHKWSYEPDPANPDNVAKRAYYGWQHHQISLNELPGGRFYPKRYVGAFEGVLASKNNRLQDGWYGEYDPATSTWQNANITTMPTEPKIVSVAGYYAKTSLSLTDFRPACERTGTGYHQYDAATNFIIQLLMIIELGHMQTQDGIGAGISGVSGTNWGNYNAYRPLRKTGDTIASGNATWDMWTLNQTMMLAGFEYRIQSLSYRGIEQPYSHIIQWVDGICLSVDGENTTAYAHDSIYGGVAGYSEYVSPASAEAAASSPNYRALPAIEGGTLEIKNVSRYWKIPSPHLLPNDDPTSRGLAAYPYDYLFYSSSTGVRAFAVGGRVHNGVDAGAFCVYSCYGLLSTLAAMGGRLCKI